MSAASQTKFTFDLLRESGGLKSTVISPVSVSIAFDQVLHGAKENTAEEIRNALAKGTFLFRCV